MRSFLLVLGFAVIPLASACSAFTGVDSDGLVAANDDAGSDNDSGQSKRDSGTSRDGGSKTDSGSITTSPGLGPECTALQSCCDFLESSEAATCRTTALDANESSCSANLTAYQSDGVCGDVSPVPVVDSGTVGPTPTIDSGLGGLTEYCSLLAGCCSTAGDASCATTVAGDDDTTCQSLYLTYVFDGLACATLP